MKRQFADSFFWLAYLNSQDAAHPRASEWMDAIKTGIVTTEWVLLEVADAMSHPRNRMAVVDFIRALRADPGVAIIEYEIDLRERGFALFATRSDKNWSLTDCTSFALMEREGISEALTGDHHFEQAGFVALLK